MNTQNTPQKDETGSTAKAATPKTDPAGKCDGLDNPGAQPEDKNASDRPFSWADVEESKTFDSLF